MRVRGLRVIPVVGRLDAHAVPVAPHHVLAAPAVPQAKQVEFVVDEPEAPLARKQNRRELFDLEVAVPLLEDRANIDHAVDVRARRGEPADRRIRGLRQEVCELAQTLPTRVGKGVNAPSAICTGSVPEVHRLGVGEAYDRCGVETHADCEALGKILVGRLGGQNRRRRVMRRDTRGVTTRLHEIGLKLGRVEAAEFRAVRIFRRRGHNFRPFLVEVDEALGNRVALDGVSAQQFRFGTSLEHRNQLPAEVEGVLHRNVHALTGLRAVRMAGVAGNEDARQAGVGLVRGDIVEAVGDALADLVHREPRHAFHVERIGAQHTLRGPDDHLLRVFTEGFALIRVDLAEVDVEANHVAAFARDEEDVALVRRLNRGLESDVRKIGDG